MAWAGTLPFIAPSRQLRDAARGEATLTEQRLWSCGAERLLLFNICSTRRKYLRRRSDHTLYQITPWLRLSALDTASLRAHEPANRPDPTCPAGNQAFVCLFTSHSRRGTNTHPQCARVAQSRHGRPDTSAGENYGSQLLPLATGLKGSGAAFACTAGRACSSDRKRGTVSPGLRLLVPVVPDTYGRWHSISRLKKEKDA